MKRFIVALVIGLSASSAVVEAQTEVKIIQQIKDSLVSKGVDLSGPCGAFEITGRVAYRLKEQGWGLVAKFPGQNACFLNGSLYAVDAIMQRDGTTVDILQNAETDNIPQWLGTGPQLEIMFREPFPMDGAEVIPPLDDPIPSVPPIDDGVHEALFELMVEMNANFNAFRAYVEEQVKQIRAEHLASLSHDAQEVEAAETTFMDIIKTYIIGPFLGGLVGKRVIP